MGRDGPSSQARHALATVVLHRHTTRSQACQANHGEAIREALILLWEASEPACGKRLKALLPVRMDAMERHGRLELGPVVRALARQISRKEIDHDTAIVRG